MIMKTGMRNIFSVLVLATSLTIVSCHKEGEGGKASVSGTVMHHTTPISASVVYIKYGESEFPGPDVSQYDAQVTADANGRYEFSSLYKGDYFLYGVGYDNNVGEIVSGGVAVEIKKNKDYSANVPVTE
jgi:hypothetical protein